MPAFNYNLDFKTTDFRQHPELYRVGKGEQGVLLVKPYKSEILPHWRFKTPDVAQKSAEAIYRIFLAFKKEVISSAWTWRGSSCKWATRAAAATPITFPAKSTTRPRSRRQKRPKWRSWPRAITLRR